MQKTNEIEVSCIKDAYEAVCRLRGFPVFVSPVNSTHPEGEDINVIVDEGDDFALKVRQMLRISQKGKVLISK